MVQYSMLDAGVPKAASPATVVDTGGAETVMLPDGIALATAQFDRIGGDLVLTAADGATFVVRDYFRGELTADLVGVDGSRMSGGLVDSLAGPLAPAMVAQATQVAEVGAMEPIGEVNNIVGEVFATRVDGARVLLRPGDPVYAGDVLETGPDGAVGIVLADSTSFSMAENGRMVLDEMIYDPADNQGFISLSVVQGLFSLVSGEVARANPDAMTVQTPVATIGIRGTQVGLDLTEPGQLGIVLMEELTGFVGEVVVSNGAGVVVMNQVHQYTFVGGANVAATPVVVMTVDELIETYRGVLTHLPQRGGLENRYGSQIDGDDLAGLFNDFTTAAGADGGVGPVGGPPVISVASPFVSSLTIPNQPLTTLTTTSQSNQQQNQGDENEDEGEAPVVAESGDSGETEAPFDPVKGGFIGDVWTQTISGAYDGSGHSFPQHITGSDGHDTILTGSGDDVVEGLGGGDLIVGNGGRDQLSGGAGDDILLGKDGGDVLVGGDGGDLLDGEAGDDVLNGGAGDDILFGGAGNDRYVYGPGDGNDEIVDASGADRLDLPGFADVTNIFRSGNDLKLSFSDGGILTIRGHFTGTSIESVYDSSADSLYVMQTTPFGGSSNDFIVGSEGNDILSGGGGNDVIFGSDGNDVIFGGANTDALHGGAGNDTFRISGTGDGVDTFFGGDGIDRILGSSADDRIGIDSVFGPDSSVEEIIGDGGFNTVEGSSSNNVIDLSATTLIKIAEIRGNGGNDLIIGSAGNDVIVGGANTDTLHGGDGDDTFRVTGTGDGFDTFYGGDGADRILGSTGDDRIGIDSDFRPDSSVEIIDGGDGLNTIDGSSSNNVIDLSATTLVNIAEIRGEAGNDVIIGSAGDDVIVGGGNNDRLAGGPGNDTFVFHVGDGQDRILDFQIGDALRFEGVAEADMDVRQNGANTIIRFASKGIEVTLENVDLKDQGYTVTDRPDGIEVALELGVGSA